MNATQERPLVWVPGLVRLDGGPVSQIHVGPAVGWTRYANVEDWKHSVHLAPRAACEAGGVALPEATIDRAAYPHVHAAARSAPFIAVAAGEAGACTVAGYRVVEIAWHRVSGGGLIQGQGGGLPRTFGGELHAVMASGDDDDDGVGVETHVRESSSLALDRILLAVSDGAVDQEAAQLAFELALAVRPEVVWSRGAALTPNARRTQAMLGDWNDWLAEVFARAAPTRGEAEALVATLTAAAADEVEAPIYGQIRRVHLPARDLGDGDDPLHLAAATRWVVEHVEVWVPSAGFARTSRIRWPSRFTPLRQHHVPVRVVVAVAVIFVVVLVMFVVMAARAR